MRNDRMDGFTRLRRMAWLPLLALAPGVEKIAAQERSLALEEVVVTATKREQSLQDVSVAVTALSAEDLRVAQITTSEDLTFLVPSLNLQKGSNPRQTCSAWKCCAAPRVRCSAKTPLQAWCISLRRTQRTRPVVKSALP